MATRERTYTWEDPDGLPEAGRRMSGLELLRSIRDGELPHPPICATIGFRFVDVAEGRVAMELEPGEHQYNPLGTVHGGVIVTLLDSVAGSAVHTALPAGAAYTTVSITTSFLRAVRAGVGTLRAEGQVIRAGRRMVLAEGRLSDAAGTLYGHATVNHLLLETERA